GQWVARALMHGTRQTSGVLSRGGARKKSGSSPPTSTRCTPFPEGGVVGGFSCGCGSWEVVSCAGVLVMSLPHLLSGILSSWTPYCGTLIPMGDIKYHARLNGSQYFA